MRDEDDLFSEADLLELATGLARELNTRYDEIDVTLCPLYGGTTVLVNMRPADSARIELDLYVRITGEYTLDAAGFTIMVQDEEMPDGGSVAGLLSVLRPYATDGILRVHPRYFPLPDISGTWSELPMAPKLATGRWVIRDERAGWLPAQPSSGSDRSDRIA